MSFTIQHGRPWRWTTWRPRVDLEWVRPTCWFSPEHAGFAARRRGCAPERLVSIVRKRGHLRRTWNMKAYLFRMARNEALNLIKRRRDVLLDPQDRQWLVACEGRDPAWMRKH